MVFLLLMKFYKSAKNSLLLLTYHTWITWFGSSGFFFCPLRARASISCSSWFRDVHSTWVSFANSSNEVQIYDAGVANFVENRFIYLKQRHLLFKFCHLRCPFISNSLINQPFSMSGQTSSGVTRVPHRIFTLFMIIQPMKIQRVPNFPCRRKKNTMYKDRANTQHIKLNDLFET